MAILNLTRVTPSGTAVVVTPGPRGDQGPAGPAGPQGPVGAIGPIGQQGATGATGPAGFGNLSVGTVSTLPAGSSATATIAGTPPNFILSFGLPAGATGPNGPGTGSVNPSGSTTSGNVAVFGANNTVIKDGGTLGDAAFKVTGTASGTLAAGDDPRIVGAASAAQAAYLLCLSM